MKIIALLVFFISISFFGYCQIIVDREYGNTILREYGIYTTPSKYDTYYSVKFDSARMNASKEEIIELFRIENLRAHGVGKCRGIYNTSVGIVIWTVEYIGDEKFNSVHYLYNDNKLTKIDALTNFHVNKSSSDDEILEISSVDTKNKDTDYFHYVGSYKYNLMTGEMLNVK